MWMTITVSKTNDCGGTGFCGIEILNKNLHLKRNCIVQRVPVFLIVALIFVALYYLTPLRDYMQSQYDGSKTAPSNQKEQEEQPFDELSLELLVITNKVANLEGRLRILKIAEEHPEWLTGEEYSQLGTVIGMTENELQEAQDEYERVKGEYARETAARIIRQSMARQQGGEGGSRDATEESIPHDYFD